MKVSLLILVHKAEKHIEKCVRSLFSQTYDRIEYVFVDDASPDRSMEIVEQVLAGFPEKRRDVKVVVNPRNLGIAESRNVALENATGEYVLFVDSDDSLAPRAVELLADTAVADNADIVVYDSWTVYEGKTRVKEEHFSESKEDYIHSLLMRQARAAMWSKLIRRELFTANGLRFVPGMNYGEDYYLSPQLVYFANKVVKLSEPLYYYLRHAASISYSLSPAKAEDVVRAADLLERFFTGVPDKEIYKPMLPEMKIRNKVAILQAGDVATWKYADGLYRGIDYRKFGLPASQRLILWLHKNHMWTAMRAYRTIAKILKRN